ncbi:unnamed protein product [Clavelina lepadiformis]|uniref:Uncharacterized protein n=1 Tax=Clavelina lepadiformis TaxID=159417 RepID=A0ABP0F2P1_CLALP
MWTDSAKEDEIVQQLRKLCDERGREIEPLKSAKWLHQLGLVYLNRSPDKICLLQSAALFNASIVRNPENVDVVKNDLGRLCSEVLRISDAEKCHTDLGVISKEVRRKVEGMREAVRLRLSSFCLGDDSGESYETGVTDFIQDLQNNITKDFNSVMRYLSDVCIDVLGNAPCEYSHVGETVIPSVAVPSLNNFLVKNGDWFFDCHTPRGICFDGLMPHASKTPLGRQQETAAKPWKTELIKPLSEMLAYLSSESDLKNGYHLADILTTTCYVSGNEDLCEEFRDQVVLYLEAQARNPHRIEILIDMIKEDLDSFAVFNNLYAAHSKNAINAKRMIYRSSTIFLSTLGKIHQVKGASCFEIVSEMEQRKIITPKAAHNLRFAIAVGCYVRLSAYMKKKAQFDAITFYSRPGESSHELELLSLAPPDDLLTYFKITFCIQQNMQKRAQTALVGDLRDPGRDAEMLILFYLGQYEKVTKICLELRKLFTKQKHKAEKIAAYTSILKESYFRLGHYESALCEAEAELDFQLQHKNEIDIADCRKAVGRCLFRLNRFHESVLQYQAELILREKYKVNDAQQKKMADCYKNIGYANFKLELFSEAFRFFREEQSILLKMTSIKTKHKLAECYTNIAGCLCKLNRFDEALSDYKSAKDTRILLSANCAIDLSVAECLSKIGFCLYTLHNYKEALDSYNNELEILENIVMSVDLKEKIEDCQYNKKACFLHLRDGV